MPEYWCYGCLNNYRTIDTKTKTLLGSKEFFIPEYFNPHSITNFGPYKLYPPQGYEYWDMEIKGASSN